MVRRMQPLLGPVLIAALALLAPFRAAGADGPPAKVVVSGTVPDDATRAAILAKVREVYGAERVEDRLGVGKQVAPPKWAQQVGKLITPDLKQVRQGRLRITGNVVELGGSVDSEAVRQEMPTRMVTALADAGYTVRSALQVGATPQRQLDAALADRTIEFDPGTARLTAAGVQVLESMLPLLAQFAGRRFEVTGYTDSEGQPSRNRALSFERALAVKNYLVSRGVAADSIVPQGAGADKPLGDNATPEGRARNRRIEFRIVA